MTIECTACHARYTIADALVPPQGARVRCRKCSAVFTVHPPAPLVTPDALPVVPPTPEPPAPPPVPPSPSVASAPRAPAAPPSLPERPSPVERSAPEPDRASAPPVPPAEPSFERFPTHAAPQQGSAPATEFERFPSSTPHMSPAPPAESPAAPESARPAARSFTETAPLEESATEETAPTETEPSPEPFPAEPSQAAAALFPSVTRERKTASFEPVMTPPPPSAVPPPASRTEPPPARRVEPPAPARPAPPAPHEGRPRISATTLPEGLSPEELQRHERARRLARVLASDIAIYNREKRERGIRDGNLVAVLGYEIKKSWETYKERVGADFANSTPYFRDALNEIVAEGKKIF